MIEELKTSNAEKKAEIERLKRLLWAVSQMARKVNDGLKERDVAEIHVIAEKQASECAKARLEEAQVAMTKLQGEYTFLKESSAVTQDECARPKESLATAENKILHLEAEAHRTPIVNEYRSSTMEKGEAAVACKAGYEYLVAELQSELRGEPSRFRYPPSIAPYLDILLDVERQGGGYDLGEDEVEGEVESEESNGRREGSDGWVKSSTKTVVENK